MKNSFLLKHFGLFLILFFGLLFLGKSLNLSQAHANFYSVIGASLSNLLNPNIYTQFREGAPPNPSDFDFTMNIWDKRKIKKRINANVSKTIKPTSIILQKHDELLGIPLVFLLALCLSSPINWMQKIIRSWISVLLFYIFLVFYLGYRFEIILNDGAFSISSAWHFICWIFSLGGTVDNLYIIMLLLWGVLFLPLIFKSYTTNLNRSSN